MLIVSSFVGDVAMPILIGVVMSSTFQIEMPDGLTNL